MKKMIKKIIGTAVMSGIVLCATSCNSWLDVTPQGQVEAEELYETAKGCNSALGGVYYLLSSENLYGKNLTYGMMDALAQYYEPVVAITPSHNFYELAQYNYENSTCKSYISRIWGAMYQAVNECNAFIHYVEPNAGKIDYSELLLGEAYALRAYIHMELFEMFGQVIHTKADLSKKAIAYRNEFNITAKLFNTGDEVLNLAEADLQKALEMLKDDPIKQYGRRGDANQSLLNYYDVLNYRGARMNYFCVLGLLSRLEMLRLNPDKAYTYATRVMDESKDVMSLIDKSGIESNSDMGKDFNYSQEMLGAIYVNDLYTMTNKMFYMEGESAGSNAAIPINTNMYEQLMKEVYGREPDGSGTDNRLRYWFMPQENSTTVYDFKKLHKAYDGGAAQLGHYPEVPIMRMSEIYYIACETQIGKNNTLALQYLNDVRRTRNLADIEGPLDDETLREYMIRDARKDFIGEGRMFLMYKRLFSEIYVKTGKIIAPVESNFVFPIPDDEYEYTDNEKPGK